MFFLFISVDRFFNIFLVTLSAEISKIINQFTNSIYNICHFAHHIQPLSISDKKLAVSTDCQLKILKNKKDWKNQMSKQMHFGSKNENEILNEFKLFRVVAWQCEAC